MPLDLALRRRGLGARLVAVAVALRIDLLRVGRATSRVGHLQLQLAAPQQRRVALALELGDL